METERRLPILFYPSHQADRDLAAEVLSEEQFNLRIVDNLDDLCRLIDDQSGALLLSEELFSEGLPPKLAGALAGAPQWSLLPIIVFTMGSDQTSRAIRQRLRLEDVIHHITFLERPVQAATLRSAVLVALRARTRQIASSIQFDGLLRLKDQLQRATTELSEAGRRKDEFLTMLSHELRSPLASISSGLRLLSGNPDPDRRDWCIDLLSTQVHNLIRLTDDLLDAARMTWGTVTMQRKEMDLGEITRRAVEALAPVLEQRQQRLRAEIEGDSAIPVFADSARLSQVLHNLIINASKYSDDGSEITVKAGRSGELAVITVIDQGVGIPPQFIEKIFDPFTQIPGSNKRSHGGFGLGLAIVRMLVERHGGSVRACSDGPGKGSKFIVELPLLGASEQEPDLKACG